MRPGTAAKELANDLLPRRNLPPAIKSGVKIAHDTDLGEGDHTMKFGLLVDNGLAPLQALFAATRNAADRVGSVQAGRCADLGATAGNPLEDPAQFRHVVFVMKGGIVYRRDDAEMLAKMKLMSISLRKAETKDIPALQSLIARSARGLSGDDYRPAQVEGALRGAFGVDSQLLDDQTYFAAEENGSVIGCGGWSYRATLFGGDSRAGRDASVLDPRTEPAKIRAFFVDPRHARRGIGSLLLEHCEREARRRGFLQVELMATLPGARLYAARGYAGSEIVRFEVGLGESIEFIPMRKRFDVKPG